MNFKDLKIEAVPIKRRTASNISRVKTDSKISTTINLDSNNCFIVKVKDKIYTPTFVGNVKYLFSTAENDKYPINTIRETFKTRSLNDNTTDYWKPFYDGMKVKGTIENDMFVIDYKHLISNCTKHLKDQHNEHFKRTRSNIR